MFLDISHEGPKTHKRCILSRSRCMAAVTARYETEIAGTLLQRSHHREAPLSAFDRLCLDHAALIKDEVWMYALLLKVINSKDRSLPIDLLAI